MTDNCVCASQHQLFSHGKPPAGKPAMHACCLLRCFLLLQLFENNCFSISRLQIPSTSRPLLLCAILEQQPVFGKANARLMHCQLMLTDASSITTWHQLAPVTSTPILGVTFQLVRWSVSWFVCLFVSLSACCSLSIHPFGFAQVGWHPHQVQDQLAFSVAHWLGKQHCLIICFLNLGNDINVSC